MDEWEEEPSVCDIESTHTVLSWVCVDKHAVIPAIAMAPGINCTYAFWMHAANARYITGGIKRSHSGGISGDFGG